MDFAFASVAERLQLQATHLIGSLPLLVLALVVVWLAWRAGGWLSRRSSLERVARRNPFLRDLVKTSTRWAVTLGGILVALEILNATALVGAVLGTAGVLGVALGFAFKETLENYLAGILMSVRQPFAPRDHVVIDGNEGVVIALTSRATVLMTLDGNHLRLPNALVFRSVMLNYTRNPTRRFEFDVGVGVNEDLLCAQRLGTAQLGRVDGVIATPPPRAYIASLGDSNVQVRFHGWVDQRTHDFLLVKSEAIRSVKLALEEAGMDMPEPIYRVQLSERGPAGVSEPPQPAQAEKRPTDAAPLDTRVQTDLDGPIRSDESTRGSEDLLNPEAPRE
ncbi:MAG: mechanosensitive ion channel family protein [Burkholderiaceae bacterium]|nr:mechanosensitive ion channel family protein [Burkholderiaceae bacterium]